MLAADYKAEYGVQQVAEQIRQSLESFLESRYHVRDLGLIEERRHLLREHGIISREPFIETTPMYEFGQPYTNLKLPEVVKSTFTELSKWIPDIGLFERPYLHQANALEAFLQEESDVIVATGTGSGKTEVFLFSILGNFLAEATERTTSFKYNACRALLLYPTNALVNDQVSRLRRLFGDERLAKMFLEKYARNPRFGMYTSRTPYPGMRRTKRDNERLVPIIGYYIDLLERAGKDNKIRELIERLFDRGRWPAKDLRGFYGDPASPMDMRFRTQTTDRELFTRHEIHETTPDLLVTNYSMLEYMLLRPIERSIFDSTVEWLKSDKRNQFILVLDEAHTYRGAAGAEVALLVRRLQARLGIPRNRMRCILTSASLGDDNNDDLAIKFASELVGAPSQSSVNFKLITGVKESRPKPYPGTNEDAKKLATFDIRPFYLRASKSLNNAIEAIKHLAVAMEWSKVSELCASKAIDSEDFEACLRTALYDVLHGYGPIELLVQHTSGSVMSFKDLCCLLFPDSIPEVQELATTTLLALGTYSNNGNRPLLPTRVHLLFRALPPIYACTNSGCNKKRTDSTASALLGRLYSESRTHCDCDLQARVYELCTHNRCGTAFLRVFGKGSNSSFYWHERGGDIENFGEPLEETFLLLEEPHEKMISTVQPIWLDVSTGRVSLDKPGDSARYRKVFRPAAKTDNAKSRSKRRTGDNSNSLDFSDCPACTKSAKNKITSLETKGEQSFATIVREQFVLQSAIKKPDATFPNGGRKLLIFSDGRQKAARLARDLPREVEFDSFRYALVLACHNLRELGCEPKLDSTLYKAFLHVCETFHLNFFDNEGESQRKFLADVRRYREDFDGELLEALESDDFKTPPLRFRQNLLRQLSDPFYSLNSACVAVVGPSKNSLRQFTRQVTRKLLDNSPPENIDNQVKSICSCWIQELLDRSAFDPTIPKEMRYEVDRFFRPTTDSDRISNLDNLLKRLSVFDDAKLSDLSAMLFERFTDVHDGEDGRYLKPETLTLNVALDEVWWQCTKCHVVEYNLLYEHCSNCGHKELAPLDVDHPYMQARNGYFREPFRALSKGAEPIHLTAEEHSAQLSHRDHGQVYATTEEFELRFQDITLDNGNKPPIDVLSCTTTMEMGIDLGALTAVAMRNVPPQRQNYQQRAGRAGRRGSAVSTVLTYAQGDIHENYYFHHPEEMISGNPKAPRIDIDNPRLATRHINSFLFQTFFQNHLERLDKKELDAIKSERTNLLNAFGSLEDFFGTSDQFSLERFIKWISEEAQTIDFSWLPEELLNDCPDKTLEKQKFGLNAASSLISSLNGLKQQWLKQRKQESNSSNDLDEEQNLLDFLFDSGLLPTYAFPIDVGTFYVFGEDERNRTVIKERPQQSKVQALSEYAPGRALVVNKKTYRVGGIFKDGFMTTEPIRYLFEQELDRYTSCKKCTYVSLEKSLQVSKCPVCQSELIQFEIIDPPGFAPEEGRPLSARDKKQEISYATSAQLPTPIQPEKFSWKNDVAKNVSYTYQTDQKLIVVNKGPKEEGFQVCTLCGASHPASSLASSSEHFRPFPVPTYVQKRENASFKCLGPWYTNNLFLGTTIQTDLLLLRFQLKDPLDFNPQYPWIHDAVNTLSEALALGACIHLDIDTAELKSGYRLLAPNSQSSEKAIAGLADIYLYDTAPGGAGFADQAGIELNEVLERTRSLLENCPGDCQTSCWKCLRHHMNRQQHDRLDRNLALALLEFALNNTVPKPLAISIQSTLLKPLKRYMELEGWEIRSEPRYPLSVKSPSTGEIVAVSLKPALVSDRYAQNNYGISTGSTLEIQLEDYVAIRDLPTSLRRIEKIIHGSRSLSS